GTISASPSEALMLTYPETVYISFPNQAGVKVGERYLVFRPRGEVIHPLTDRRYGFLTQVVGTVRVLKKGAKVTTAQIEPDSLDEIHRGDRIGPAGEKLVTQRPPGANDKALGGLVLARVDP